VILDWNDYVKDKHTQLEMRL